MRLVSCASGSSLLFESVQATSVPTASTSDAAKFRVMRGVISEIGSSRNTGHTALSIRQQSSPLELASISELFGQLTTENTESADKKTIFR